MIRKLVTVGQMTGYLGCSDHGIEDFYGDRLV